MRIIDTRDGENDVDMATGEDEKQMSKEKLCPIQGCSKKWRTYDGLFDHLYQYHIKTELVFWILKHLDG